MTKNKTSFMSYEKKFKRIFDILVAVVSILVLFPVLLIIAILVGNTGMPILYKHKRVGLNGRLFYCYKFRTMYNESDALLKELLDSSESARREWHEKFKLRNDPRVTSLGLFLRKTSLDELPQLYNILIGDMSFVGPRPVTEQEIIKFYFESKSMYYKIRPGLTGLWQVSGRSDMDYVNRVNLDMSYVNNISLKLDLKIIFKTMTVVALKKGAF